MSREVVVLVEATEVVVEGRVLEVTVETTTQEVVVDKAASEVVIETAVTEVVIEVVGARGERGPPGSGTAYVHNQNAANATWTINHNLGYRPSVELIEAGGAEFDGEIIHTSVNQTVVYLTEPTAGLARLN